ncbi:ribbon-helix-helix domain-containing protein [Sphingomonas radiodurans]|uniref:ribbon-helix-helix domain-containing protein n=1 Tax=Sphingomonas radiodurans TaxID=2890321 RepID=UPI001E5CDB20|nr:type II toxin-antitoxin system ParD family antitoxin [Sphingomonas radiodurans]WBH15716.1 type II toxin-antitoxin system ParD family antitoxin [Sphingomonas radiodurans]
MAKAYNLTPESVRLVDRLVASGRYGSHDAVVDRGLRLLDEQERWETMVEAKVAQGRAEIARGEGISMDQVFEELRERYRNWPK